MISVQCASCKKTVDHSECYQLYVGMGGYNFICEQCKSLPFLTIMENIAEAESYVGYPPKTLDQVLTEKTKPEIRWYRKDSAVRPLVCKTCGSEMTIMKRPWLPSWICLDCGTKAWFVRDEGLGTRYNWKEEPPSVGRDFGYPEEGLRADV